MSKHLKDGVIQKLTHFKVNHFVWFLIVFLLSLKDEIAIFKEKLFIYFKH